MRNKLFNFMGSKFKIVSLLISRFPRKFRRMRFGEVFGGAGILLYLKPRSVQEIYNDYDSGISAIFWHLIHDYDRFTKSARNLIYSQDMYKWFKELDTSNMNRFDLALRTLYLIHLAFSGGFGNNMIDVPQRPDNRHIIFDDELWEKWQRRFDRVFVKNLDFQAFVEKYDSENTFFYLDPPYTIAKDTGYYNIIFSDKDHLRLFETLQDIEGKFLLSYNNDPDISDLYEEFFQEEIQIRYQAKKTNKKDHKELLISNYKVKTLGDYL